MFLSDSHVMAQLSWFRKATAANLICKICSTKSKVMFWIGKTVARPMGHLCVHYVVLEEEHLFFLEFGQRRHKVVTWVSNVLCVAMISATRTSFGGFLLFLYGYALQILSSFVNLSNCQIMSEMGCFYHRAHDNCKDTDMGFEEFLEPL